jgi:hypothetical protein
MPWNRVTGKKISEVLEISFKFILISCTNLLVLSRYLLRLSPTVTIAITPYRGKDRTEFAPCIHVWENLLSERTHPVSFILSSSQLLAFPNENQPTANRLLPHHRRAGGT